MNIQIDGTKFVNKGAKAKIVVGSAEQTKGTEKAGEKQPVGKRSVNIEPAAKMNISKTGYASLAYDGRPFSVSGKSMEETMEILGIIDTMDAWRMKDPESYEKHGKIVQEAYEYRKSGNEEMFVKTLDAASSFFLSWVKEQMATEKYDFRAVAYNGIRGLKSRYGDDTEINVSSPDENDARGSMWRFGGGITSS